MRMAGTLYGRRARLCIEFLLSNIYQNRNPHLTNGNKFMRWQQVTGVQLKIEYKEDINNNNNNKQLIFDNSLIYYLLLLHSAKNTAKLDVS